MAPTPPSYIHAGEGDIAVAPYTIDADLALDPRALSDEPFLERLLRLADILPAAQPGSRPGWRAA